MANVFGPGVSGGFLAAAGALGGLGKGLVEAGEYGMKEQLAQKENDLQTMRETAIARLNASNAKDLEAQRETYETGRTEKELQAQSNVAHFQVQSKATEAEKARTWQSGENTKKETSEERRTRIAANARVEAAGLHASASAKPPKGWTVHSVTEQPTFSKDAQGNVIQVPGRSHLVLQHPDGRLFNQIGDKLMPYDSTTDQTEQLKSFARPPAAAVADLVNDPTGKAPNGMPKSDAYLQAYGHLPLAWVTAMQRATNAQRPQVPGLGRSVAPPGSMVRSMPLGGGATEEQPDNSDNVAESSSEADTGLNAGNDASQIP